MRVGMVLLTGFPPDIRIEKEHATLSAEHDVFLLCPRRGEASNREMWNGLSVQRVFSNYERQWNNFRLLASQYSRGWARAIAQFIDENRLDILHVHDLPLLGTALRVARRMEVPVVADLHENYPAMLAESKKKRLVSSQSFGSFILQLVVSVPRWIAYEKTAVSQADAVITVIEEAKDRLKRIGISESTLHVVANYGQLNGKAEVADGMSPVAANPQNREFKVVYAGGFDETRDLSSVVDAIGLIGEDEIPNLRVSLIGGNRRAIQALERRLDRIRGAHRVELIEWMPRDEVERVVEKADVGLVPHVKSDHTDNTIPHKLFQYMERQLPVIVSDCDPLNRIVSDARCGLVYRSGDADSFARRLVEMWSDPDRMRRMGEAGLRAVTEKYNWAEAGRNLLKIYRSFLTSGSRS